MVTAKRVLCTIVCMTALGAGACVVPESGGLATLPSSKSLPAASPGAINGVSAANVALCHVTGNGRFQLLAVNISAQDAHLAHGDGVPGGTVPGLPTNTFGPECETARVDIEKSTNGVDADNAPGPSILIGDPVTWLYEVSNVGEVDLTNVAVTDDVLGAITCPATELAVGASMTCSADGVAALGPYVNIGTVTADSILGPATDSDSSHYVGVDEVVSPDDESEEGEDNEEELDDSEGTPSVKVDLCHRTGNGRYHLLNVSIDAQPAHLAHGDGVPGGAVPNQPAMVFGPTCDVVPVIQ